MTDATAPVETKRVAAMVTAATAGMIDELRSRPRRVTYIDLYFGDGAYHFALGGKEIAELERLCGYTDGAGLNRPTGIGAIYARMARGRAFLPTGDPDWANMHVAEALACEIVERDVVATIRLALIGGGRGVVDGCDVKVSPGRAVQLVDTYVVEQPLEDNWTIAFAILSALIYGVAPEMTGTEDPA